MNQKTFAAKLKQIPVVEPDDIDLAMLAEAKAMDDGSTVPLEAFMESPEK